MRAVLTSPLLRNVLLCVCCALPWLNPFTSPPSTSVLPLLLSWMMAACALLLVADLPLLKAHIPTLGQRDAHWLTRVLGSDSFVWLSYAVVLGVCVSLLTVPQVVDVGATAGLVAAVVCMVTMAWVGRRVAWYDNRLMPWLVGAWIAAAVISSVLGVLQYLDMGSALSPWVNQPAFKGDAFANLRQRNQFASLTSIGLVALLAASYALLQLEGKTHARRFVRQPYTFATAFVLLNVLAIGAACSMSRTAVLQWVAVSVLALLWTWRQHARRTQNAQNGRVTQEEQSAEVEQSRQDMHSNFAWYCLVLSAPLLLLLWSFAMPLLAQHFTGQQGANLAMRVAGASGDYGVCGSRSVLWTNVWQLIVQKPWLGWGWGETDLAHFLTLYKGQRFCDILDNAHNLPLHLALEFGVPLALFAVLSVVSWVWLRKPWQEREIWRVMAWGALLVVGLHSLLEYPLWYGPFQMAVGLCVGLLWVKPSHEHDVHRNVATVAITPAATPTATTSTAPVTSTMSTTSQANEAWSLLLATVFFMACLYAAWDFNRVSQIYKPVAQRDPAYSSNPLAYAKQSWLFRNQAEFAELTLQSVTASNAQAVYDQAQRVVHYSPEPRVVQRLIDSARLLGHDDEADHWALRLAAHQQATQR
jgi:Virulence factor membrane-bound polymerase, C-terminal/O-Antigen ligase/Protein glycosylation ligase